MKLNTETKQKLDEILIKIKETEKGISLIIFISIFTIGFIFIARYAEKPFNDFIKDKDANCVIIDKTAPVTRSNLYMLVLKCDNSKEKDKLFKKPITMEEYYQYEIGESYK